MARCDGDGNHARGGGTSQQDIVWQFERKLANIRNSEIRQQVRNNAVNDEQRRAFLVSFVGESESTDDVGGQYRELFNELSNELCVHGVFGLFVKHHKYVIPNASLRDSESIARFELVGKIMGMAMRARIQIPLDNLTPLVWKFLTHDTSQRTMMFSRVKMMMVKFD